MVGTSLVFELKGNEAKLVSKMHDSFVIARKRQGPIPALAEKTLINPLADLYEGTKLGGTSSPMTYVPSPM